MKNVYIYSHSDTKFFKKSGRVKIIMFVFSMRAKGSDSTIVARQRDRAKVVASKARVRENDEEASPIRQGEQAQHVLPGGG